MDNFFNKDLNVSTMEHARVALVRFLRLGSYMLPW